MTIIHSLCRRYSSPDFGSRSEYQKLLFPLEQLRDRSVYLREPQVFRDGRSMKSSVTRFDLHILFSRSDILFAIRYNTSGCGATLQVPMQR